MSFQSLKKAEGHNGLHVRLLSARQCVDLQKREDDGVESAALLFAISACDENGNRYFDDSLSGASSDEDKESTYAALIRGVMEDVPLSVLNEVCVLANEHNGFTQEQQEGEEKK